MLVIEHKSLIYIKLGLSYFWAKSYGWFEFSAEINLSSKP